MKFNHPLADFTLVMISVGDSYIAIKRQVRCESGEYIDIGSIHLDSNELASICRSRFQSQKPSLAQIKLTHD